MNAYVQAAGDTAAVNVWPAIVAFRVCWTVVVFGDAVTVTFPLPDPDVGVTDSAALDVEADQADGAHPDGAALTFTTCDPPSFAKFAVAGEIVNVHAALPATVAVKVWPAMVAVSVCWSVVVFGDAVTVTLPLPDPDVGVTDSAVLGVEADHADGAHPDGAAVTFTTCEPPPVATFVVDGEIVNVHAVVVAVGWVVELVPDGGSLLHAAVTTSISETANAWVRFIARANYTGPVWSANSRSLSQKRSTARSAPTVSCRKLEAGSWKLEAEA